METSVFRTAHPILHLLPALGNGKPAKPCTKNAREIHKKTIVFSGSFCYTSVTMFFDAASSGCFPLLWAAPRVRNTGASGPKGRFSLETPHPMSLCPAGSGAAGRLPCPEPCRLRLGLQQLHLVCGGPPLQPRPPGRFRPGGCRRLREPLQRPCPQGGRRPAEARSGRELDPLRRPPHLHLCLKKRPDLHRRQGRRHHHRHHGGGFRLRVPAAVPRCHSFPLRCGVFRH